MKKTHPDDQKDNQTNVKIVELERELNEFQDRWKRVLADYHNLEKRHAEDRQHVIRFAAKEFILKLLPVLDDLEKAVSHLNDEGLKLILKKFVEILKSEGVERFTTIGEKFNIERMEAISTVEGKDDGEVVAEHRPGYLIHGSVLRPAQVTISKKQIDLDKKEAQ
ncbi:nucleotide exchange factor GrpE [Candidatus Gottesmanbacteria bacterium]|nr:nucleotide exchange factor GrpE [Candidatus Gottesmanbacteria bacterium]